MKKTVLLVLTVLLLLIGGFYTFDAYLCSHLYYGWGAMTTCSGGQGEGLNMLGKSSNRGALFWALITALIPVGYLFFSKNISLKRLIGSFVGGSMIYMVGFGLMKDALLSPGRLILMFNVILIFAVLFFALTSLTTLGHWIFGRLKRHIGDSMHDVFLQFTVGLIAFCFFNVLLLLLGVYWGVVVWLQVAGLIYLLWNQKKFLKKLSTTTTAFIKNIHNTFRKNSLISVLYTVLLIVTCIYIYMGLNGAYIPYPTAWDANHAYIFLPRAWAINHGMYRGQAGAASVPYLWYGFLTFWFKLAQSFPIGSGLFGISPDSLTVIMNFWSGPLVLFASVFLLHTFVEYLQGKKAETTHEIITLTVLCVGWALMLLWLTSGMGAFLVFVDNKPDLAVMFFGIIALYMGIKFIKALTDSHESKALTTQYAILAGLFFAASILAKPTGMFDMVHFGVLFLLQWEFLALGVAAYVAILGVLAKTQMFLVNQFITLEQANYLMIIGLVAAVVIFVLGLKKHSYRHYIRYFLIWIGTIVVTLIAYKAPYLITQQLKLDGKIDIKQTVRGIFLAYQTPNTDTLPSQAPKVLLAANISTETLQEMIIGSGEATGSSSVYSSNILTKEQCIQQAPADLYANLKPTPNDASSEDFGRYIGYGWKGFSSLGISGLIPEGCYSIYSDAQFLCSQYGIVSSADSTAITGLLEQAPQTERIVNWRKQLQESNGDQLATQSVIKSIDTFVQTNSINKTEGIVYVPYKLLVPFNVTFNWSLQNLSSYYTDIGIMWLLGLGLVILGLFYGLFLKQRKLVVISLITLGAWATWWIVGSAIIWYSLGLIMWTILSVIAYVYYLFKDKSHKTTTQVVSLYMIAGLLILWSSIQLLLNLIRISSQGGSGPFVRYKANVGQETVIDDLLQADVKNKVGYSAQDVFNVQFPHYNKLLNLVNKKTKEEGVIVAGTYSQYFMNDQYNVVGDGFLTQFWTNASDNNVCNTYLRLQDKKTKYIVIDPNIASVVMGAGNSTLLDRFLGVIDTNNKLAQYGTLTMLQSLVQQHYLSLYTTNNIVTKYAFIIPDEKLSSLLNIPAGEQLLVERAKMSSARYFPNAQAYGDAALEIFVGRVATYEAIQDIADIIGKEIREPDVVAAAKTLLGGIKQDQYEQTKTMLGALTDDERFVLQQYMSLAQAQKQNPAQFRQYVIRFISQSINNGSQIIVLTVE